MLPQSIYLTSELCTYQGKLITPNSAIFPLFAEYILSLATSSALLVQSIPIFMISCPFLSYTNYPYNF